jgi:hypothetical protein
MEDYLFSNTTFMKSIVFEHHGLSDLVTPNVFLIECFRRRFDLPVRVLGHPRFVSEIRKRTTIGDAGSDPCFYVVDDEGFEALDLTTAFKVAVTTLHATPHMLSRLNTLEHLPVNSHVHGRVVSLKSVARFSFPNEFAPDHYATKDQSFFTPPSTIQKKSKNPTLSFDFDSALRRKQGRYDGRVDRFMPLNLATFACKIAAMVENLDTNSLVLASDVRPIVLALECAGYRCKGRAAYVDAVSDGKTYAVQCGDVDWDTVVEGDEDVVVARKRHFQAMNPSQVHVMDPAEQANLASSIFYTAKTTTKLFMHATMGETYPLPNVPHRPRPPLRTILSETIGLRYVVHESVLVGLAEVCGFTEDEIAFDDEVMDRRGVKGHVVRSGPFYVFQKKNCIDRKKISS